MEVIKEFVKTKENGESKYKMLSAWLGNCSSIFTFIQKNNKRYKEREDGKKMLGEQLSRF